MTPRPGSFITAAPPDLPDAACREHPTLPADAWFPRSARDTLTRFAIAACHDCPALEACSQWATDHRPTAGVWAGRLYGNSE